MEVFFATSKNTQDPNLILDIRVLKNAPERKDIGCFAGGHSDIPFLTHFLYMRDRPVIRDPETFP